MAMSRTRERASYHPAVCSAELGNAGAGAAGRGRGAGNSRSAPLGCRCALARRQSPRTCCASRRDALGAGEPRQLPAPTLPSNPATLHLPLPNEPSRPLAQASPRSPIHPHPPFSVLLFFPNGLTIALPVAFTAAVRPAGESLNLCFKLKGLL